MFENYIKCNKREVPTNQYTRIEFGTQCIAEANNGFQFNSWVENLGKNSSKTVSTATISDNPFNSLLQILGYQKDNASAFSTTRFGNFTANFQKASPPVPPEYWIPLYGVIVSSIVGWSVPSIIGWITSKKQVGKLHRFRQRITYLYRDGELDQNDITAEWNTLIDNNKPSYTQERISRYQSEATNNDFTGPIKNEYNAGNLVYYENSHIGIKIQYPSKWNLQQKEHYPDHPSDRWSQVLGLRSDREIHKNSDLENVSIYVKSLDDKNVSVDEFTYKHIDCIRKKFTIIETTPIVLAKGPGYKVLYTDKKGYDTIEVWTIQRNNVYTIKCITKAKTIHCTRQFFIR